MKNLLLLSSLLIVAISCNQNGKSTPSSSLEFYADSLFQANVDSAQIAGGAILVAKDGEILLKKSYGYASLELSVPMPEDAKF